MGAVPPLELEPSRLISSAPVTVLFQFLCPTQTLLEGKDVSSMEAMETDSRSAPEWASRHMICQTKAFLVPPLYFYHRTNPDSRQGASRNMRSGVDNCALPSLIGL